jgi:phosphatidylinositol phospholipase C delta
MDKQFGDRPHTDAQEQIDFVGVERLCKSLHIHGVYGHLRTNFIKADLTKSGRLSYSEFQNFINLMKAREEIRWIFYERAKRPEVGMTLNEFLSFLHECQGEDVHNNRSHWDFVFNMFTGRRPQTKGQPTQEEAPGGVVYMNESALTAFLTSKFNLPIKETPAQYSLDRPLHEYYISSSHNTYLLGRQVAGQSSVEAYISALQGGCRCVEIDCWDGADGPVVMHGRTLTSQVSFADVMTTISKYAFVKSPFPLILSLEVHCSRQQQATMADIIKRTCGSRLVTEPLDPTTQQLPSPSQLLNKILIKVKMPGDDESGPLDSPLGRRRGASVSSPYMRPVADATPLLAEKQLYSPPGSPKLRSTTVKSVSSSKTTLVTESQESLHSSTSENESTSEEPPRTKQSNIVKVLGELGVYTAGVKFHGFETAESKTYNHVYSFMESTFARNSKTQDSKRALVRHNMRYLMRVYPNGWRVSSTNFNPLAYWRRGVQMAALNWQTYDLGMQFNDAMFAGGTDASGYVLKPSGLRQITMMTAIPEAAGPTFAKRERKIVKFSIEVISAQQLMRPKTLPPHRTFDPYVEVEVYHADDKTKQLRGVVGEGGHDDSGLGGSSGLGTPRRLRTQIVSENGFNPIFNKSFQFELTTKYPELVFVRWTVRVSRDGHNYDDRSAPLAIYTAKLSNLKEGYRTLPLNDSNGDRWLFSTLFCRTKIHETTSIYVDQAAETINKLKALGRTILSKTNSSPKSSSDHIHQL